MNRRAKAFLAATVLPLAAVAALLPARPSAAASLTRVTGFGPNPSNLNMYVYVPDRVAPRPALLVAIHYCTGSASALFNGYFRDYVTAADQYGYVIVFPEATRSGQCFDVYSPEALVRGGGSDPVGIMSMVSYARSRYNIDPNRIFVSGVSSGAMMTNVLAAEYPDVFRAGVAFMGVPAGCFATGSSSNTWNSQCANGQIIRTAQQWGDLARSMFPGYSGAYPRMQLWHGTTDTTLHYNNFGEEVKQWTNLHRISQTPVRTDSPQPSWTRTRYGADTTHAPVEGMSVSGVGHSLPLSGMIRYAIDFLGLNGTGSGTTTTSTATSTTTTTTTSSTTTTLPPGGGSCQVAYVIQNQWPGGFTANLTITNRGTSPINGWTLTWTFPAGQGISNGWNAEFSVSGAQVTARNAPWNGNIPAGGSVSFGFNGTFSGSNPSPGAFTLNGTTCATA